MNWFVNYAPFFLIENAYFPSCTTTASPERNRSRETIPSRPPFSSRLPVRARPSIYLRSFGRNSIHGAEWKHQNISILISLPISLPYLSSPSSPAALLNPQAWNALNASNHFGRCYTECNIRRLLPSSILYSIFVLDKKKKKKKKRRRKKVTLMSLT